MRSRKKLIGTVIMMFLLLLLLVPQPRYYKDGGTVEYHAVLYQIFDWHQMRGQAEDELMYYDGLEVRILGITVYNGAQEKGM